MEPGLLIGMGVVIGCIATIIISLGASCLRGGLPLGVKLGFRLSSIVSNKGEMPFSFQQYL